MKSKIKQFTALFLSIAVLFAYAPHIYADTNAEDKLLGSTYQEIADAVATMFGVNMQVELDLRKGRSEMTAEDLYAIQAHLVHHATITAETNAMSRKLWEARTGIPLEDAVQHTSQPLAVESFSTMNVTRHANPLHHDSWIVITLRGAIQTNTNGVRTWNRVDNITSESSHTSGPLAVSFSSRSFTYSIIDGIRTVAAHVTGLSRIRNPIVGLDSTSEITLYTEFHSQ